VEGVSLSIFMINPPYWIYLERMPFPGAEFRGSHAIPKLVIAGDPA
jgi:hypothetical protein